MTVETPNLPDEDIEKLVKFAIKPIPMSYEDYEEAVSNGYVVAVEAKLSWRPNSGCKLSTWIIKHVRWATMKLHRSQKRSYERMRKVARPERYSVDFDINFELEEGLKFLETNNAKKKLQEEIKLILEDRR